ncbi:glutamate-5-semialdehyde dehydrogenase [Halalkalibacterium halodurans]|uniref:Gamma-glutamyl phosphate reductase n=1 Tax=Halalkalibacterium halodurans (strain ATCC BAA-125 / DSM 18197 / FERM 7344 / JCM 9153 / C-125) TaxID=272558 RepID=PROA_HALH5|nr:glutamate-5-semialdehyde dehydrogenase [Halalkalibacterium halodurans]Q9KCR5.1 RecName: Full=Gamma-glutamyl phosphate reductase; Short=GPR; AltName: Full=Glutamate-5-semialdehyde dehydrogenase; AltName: Full=Glutamyl-gamma-semialdehyde dehydrogenase; Short=GSA dehydrogenase [Halalkalibacterium halodurans C-125]MED4082914.1 glutamate-5-semialdehyde dehydrogenase [Halalkalibacterium halodurans]MED4084800.1 glutamate-5-semialdehyde dehydrogenase [Halalkalibacterium halodurans]MED4106092.1 gluta
MSELIEKAKQAQQASKQLAILTTEEKNRALKQIADQLLVERTYLIEENQKDIEAGQRAGISQTLLDRLLLTDERVQAMAEGVEQVIALDDPIGDQIDEFTRPNGLNIRQVRVPLGVIGMIYEARPNVTVDASVLCLKSGNAVLLRGSSSALHSNKALVSVIHRGLEAANVIPKDAVQLLEDTSRETAKEMFKLNDYLDVLIPRGGANLIQSVVKEASVPVLETGVGNCHVYIDESADPEMAVAIAVNAKTQRPSVCNAAETILVHSAWAKEHVSKLIEELRIKEVQIAGDEQIKAVAPFVKPADESDWGTEYLDLQVAMKIVNSVDEAIAHIDRYGSKHSEAIVSETDANVRKFLTNVDATTVYHNASTRFTDGFEFGFGAEIGISTQKLHARGPMGLRALTSSKYVVHGTGQIKK